MAFGKCDNCEQTVKVKQTKQKYILPLFLFFSGLLTLAYERDFGNPHSVVTVLGGFATTVGFVWLVVKGIRYISK